MIVVWTVSGYSIESEFIKRSSISETVGDFVCDIVAGVQNEPTALGGQDLERHVS
jgi:hypothetical protein